MSSTRHIVQRPNLIGLGKRPVLTPSHQQDFLTGMIGGVGGTAFGSPMICGKRRKPVSGRKFIYSRLYMVNNGLNDMAADSFIRSATYPKNRAYGTTEDLELLFLL
jgi:hypothetical protein